MNQQADKNLNRPIPAKEVPVGEKPAQEMPLQPAAPLWSFKELLSYSWKYFKALLKKIWPLLGVLFIVDAVRVIYELFFPTTLEAVNLTQIGISIISGILSGLIIMIFMGFVIPVVSFILLHSFYEQAPESLNKALKKLIPLAMPYTIVALLSGLIILGGYIFFIIPGIIFGIWLSFSTIVLIVENRRGFEALLRSAGLVLGSSRSVFWRFLGLGLVTGITALLLNAPTFIVGIIAGAFSVFTLRQDPTMIQELAINQLPFHFRVVTSLGSLWSSLITLLIPPFTFSYTYLLFRNLKQIKGEVVAYDKKNLFRGFMILGTIGIIVLIIGSGFLIFWLTRLYFLKGNF